MAIEFARARFISRSSGGNAVRSAAYSMREEILCDRTGERHKYRDNGTLAHHEILLPAGASAEFLSPDHLWNAVEAAERRKDSQVAMELVIALPSDILITDDDRLALARSFAQQHFVDRGLAVQIDIHKPHSSSSDQDSINFHGHLLITTRRIEGDRLSALKARDLQPAIRWVGWRPFVTAAHQWGALWRDHQNAYFSQHGKSLAVDPVAPHPGEHLGPKRFRDPRDPRLADAASLRDLNAKVARDPRATVEHLRDQQQRFDGPALERFLRKHVADPTEVEDLKRKAIEAATWADKVPSGWRKLTVEDVARELSPEYANLVKRTAELRKEAEAADWTQNRQGGFKADKLASEHRIAERWGEMGVVRRIFHLTGARTDREIERWQDFGKRADYVNQRWSIRRAAIVGELNMVTRVAAAKLEEIRPEAEHALRLRQRIAHNARDQLSAIQKNAIHKLRQQQRAPPI